MITERGRIDTSSRNTASFFFPQFVKVASFVNFCWTTSCHSWCRTRPVRARVDQKRRLVRMPAWTRPAAPDRPFDSYGVPHENERGRPIGRWICRSATAPDPAAPRGRVCEGCLGFQNYLNQPIEQEEQCSSRCIKQVARRLELSDGSDGPACRVNGDAKPREQGECHEPACHRQRKGERQMSCWAPKEEFHVHNQAEANIAEPLENRVTRLLPKPRSRA